MIDNSAGYVYFSSNETSALFRMNLDGSNQTEIYRGEKNWDWINIIDGTLYLLDWNPDDHTYVYRFNPDKQELSLINYWLSVAISSRSEVCKINRLLK